jgi:folate-dependent phosphoribosylglycinamide formyltransferase PurN
VEGDTPEKLAARIHALEHAHYPRVIEEVLSQNAIRRQAQDKIQK